MTSTPSEIIAQLLENKSLGHNPDESTVGLSGNALDWPIYINASPSEIDQFLVVFDTAGSIGSEPMRTGIPFTKEGIQVKAQADTHELCYTILRLLGDTLAGISQEGVTVGGNSHTINSISNTSSVLRNGRVSSEYVKYSATINLLVNYSTL